MPLTAILMRYRLLAAAAVAASAPLLLTACNGPRVIHESPILVVGDRVPSTDSAIAVARAAEQDRARQARFQQDSISAAASTCDPSTCAAMARGELALGMTEAQVLATTRTTPAAWSATRGGDGTVLVPATLDAVPGDSRGKLSRVELRAGRVASLGYADRTGTIVVASGSDTTASGRARAVADALIREGDELIAAGDRARALDRYDRALVLRDSDPMLTYKVAQLLDQQLRPVEALMRYQKFLLQLELQRIDAVGAQNARLAEAIALAQQRIVVLDRRR